jgi:fermentation-respiration switch protein FrsA (DUF1100 family)
MTWLIVLVAVYVSLCAAAYLLQRSFLYFPMGAAGTPAAAGLKGFDAVALETSDRLKLVAWYRAPPDQAAAVVVLFHGNAGSIADRAFKAEVFAQAGFGVLLVEYRGYGGNPGAPSEAGFYADARAAADFLARQGVARWRWVLYGESIGGGPAVHLAQELAADGKGAAGGVILEAAFASTAAVAGAHYWFLPVRLIVRDRYENAEKIAEISAPVLILHGARDEIVPAGHARRLFERAREPKTLAIVPDLGHNDLWGAQAVEAVLKFLRAIGGAQGR